MADRSKSEIIRANPIGDGLNSFRDYFHLTYMSLAVLGLLSELDKNGSNGNSGVGARS